MPSPLTLALKLGTRAYEKLHLEKNLNKFLGASVSVGLLGLYGYEKSKDAAQNFPEPILPSSRTKVPYRAPINPTAKTVLEPLHEEIKKTSEKSRESIDSKNIDLKSSLDQIQSINEKLKENASDSPFLQNQVSSKESIDSISLNLEAQTIIMGALYETLESNLSALVAVKMVEAQNAKVLTDYQKTIAEQSDLGQFFYEFIPTSEFWAKADAAYILRQQQLGWSVVEAWYPSRISAAREIALIDGMEGYYTNAQIRGEVETFRKAELSTEIRALIGQTALAQAKDQTETNAKAKEYYSAATESIRAKEVPEALTSLVAAVAPIAGWAESAKVREDYLSTPTAVKDLDGNTIAEDTAPMAVTIAKDAAMAREKTDTINFEVEDSDFPIFDTFPSIPFIGRESVFNKDISSPMSNPFNIKWLG